MGRRIRGPLFRAFERFVLGIGMTLVAFVVERRLLKAIKQGGRKALKAPVTADGEPDEGRLTATPHQVGDKGEG
jgi:hypothetical protein